MVSRREDESVREQAAQIIRPKKVKIREDWRKLHNEKSFMICTSQILRYPIKKEEMGGACGRQGGTELHTAL
jgi:hypothetical protein